MSRKTIEDSLIDKSQQNKIESFQENLDKLFPKESENYKEEEERKTIKLKNIVKGKPFEEVYPELISSTKTSEEKYVNKLYSKNWNSYCDSLKSFISGNSNRYREPSKDLIYNKIIKSTNIYFWVALLWVFLFLKIIGLFY